MLSAVDILLLLLCAQLVPAGPLRRRQDANTPQSIPKSADSTTADIVPANSGFAGPSASFLSSLLRFHQTATAFKTEEPPSQPTGNTQGRSSRPPSNTQTAPAESPSATQAAPSNPNPNNAPSPNIGQHGVQSQDGISTTTFTVTKTVLPNQQANTSGPTTKPVQSDATRPGGLHETGAGIPSNATRPTNLQTGFNQPTQGGQQPKQSSQAKPSTTFFVLGTTTLRVTVSSGHGGIPASQAAPGSSSATTTTITRMRTRLSTTTVVAASSSSAQQASRKEPAGGKSRAVATRKKTTQTFPDFSFAPTSAQTSSPTSRPDQTTVLPSIVAPSSSSSDVPTSSSSAVDSQSPPSASSSKSHSSTTTTGIAGITIVPVNPDATTVYITVTTTNAGATTTVARQTVTAKPCHGWRCWRVSRER